MVKHLDGGQPLLVLRLWNSGFYFADRKQLLWIGSVHYRIIWHHYWIPYRKPELTGIASALQQLQLALDPINWRAVYYPREAPLAKRYLTNSKIKVMLLR